MWTSCGCGSFTPRISSASSKTDPASGSMRAPCAVYSSSGIVLPTPAPDWIITSWPCSTSSLTPAGVSDTRYSSVLISVGTPTFMRCPSSPFLCHQFTRAQSQPELDPVAGIREVAAGELLHAPDAVTQRMPVAVELARGALPLAVLLDERLERADQLVAVLAARVLERSEHAVAVEPQRVVVLERQQELEGAQVAVRRHRRRGAVGERGGLERAARLVERPPERAHG